MSDPITQLDAERHAAMDELKNIIGAATRDLSPAEAKRADELQATVEAIDERKADLVWRQEAAARAAHVPTINVTPQPERRTANTPRGQARDAALRALESADQTAPDAYRQAAVEAIERDASGRIAEIAAPLANPAYLGAWAKLMRSPVQGHLEWTPSEHAAFTAVQESQRTMNIGTTTNGGYAVPFALDPSFVITGAGSINPIRKIASVKQTATSAYHAISAAQISASWDAELSEVSDDTPVLSQPAITLSMGRAFIPASFEALDDIVDLSTEIAGLMADAKDNLESSTFISGTGSAQPFGVVTSVKATSGSRVTPTTAGAYAIDDVYKVQSALPARFSANASWAASLTILNSTRRFGEGTTGSNSAFWTDLGGGVPAELAGRPIYEASAMDTVVTTTNGSNCPLIYGDWSRYYVVDHIGGTRIEPVQNLFGTTNGRPIAARGFFLHWRVGADVVDPNAFRVLYC